MRDDVLWLEDRFQHDTKDTDWLPVAGAEGWLVITRDKKIRTRPGERRAILGNGVGCFFLTQKKDPTRWQYLKLLVLTLEKMESSFATTPRPQLSFQIFRGNGRFVAARDHRLAFKSPHAEAPE